MKVRKRQSDRRRKRTQFEKKNIQPWNQQSNTEWEVELTGSDSSRGLNPNMQLNSSDIYLAWASVSWETLPKKGQ